MSALRKILFVVTTVSLLFSFGCGIIGGAGKDLRDFGTVVEKTFEPWEQHRKNAELESAAQLVLRNQKNENSR